jgi:hypothetical protein
MEQNSLGPWRGLGSFVKAREDSGNLFLLFRVSGPKQDADGETLSKEGAQNLVQAAKGGYYDLTPSHNVPISLGKSVDGNEQADGSVDMEFLLDKEDPWAVKLFKSVQDGTFKGQVSVGGKCLRDRIAKTFTPVANAEVPGHVALTMPGMAAYPDAGPLAALTKAIQTGDLEGLDWTPEKIELLRKGLSDMQNADDDLLKRDYSDEERQAMEAKGQAMPGGRYPIKDREDLKNAIQAFGRAKDKAAVKAWIKRRAKALGAEDLLPEDWKNEKERGMDETDLEKEGKRHSAADLKRIQAIHDATVELGADCSAADDGSTEEDSGKARQAGEDDLSKTLSGLGASLDNLNKSIAGMQEKLAALEDRLKKVEDSPAAPKGVINAQAPSVVEKTAGAGDWEPQEVKSAADAIRAAHQHPFTKFVLTPKQ